jgi:DNA mismatch repair protein MutS2
LCALEYDESALAAMERRDQAVDGVADVEERVRATLSDEVRSRAAELDRAALVLGETDVLVAAARFARLYDCRPAHIVQRASVRLEGARFLPLAGELESEGRRFTPIDVELHDVAVLTGPNMGGKSVCLRTCGFGVLCAAFGLPVPAERAETALFDEIAWLGIGAGDGVSGGLLSSFAQEVVRLRDVLARPAAKTFVLVDEFARTTTPQEGKALLIALIEALRERGACGMVATHLGGVASAAGVRHFAVRGLRGIPERPAAADLSEALASLARSMDYTIAEVGAGQAEARADAIALAALLGLDGGLIEAAYRALE